MNIVREFEWGESNTELGREEGWIPTWIKGFDAVTSGMLAAHDVMEHMSIRPGLEHEMLAFGSMLWIRGQADYWADAGLRDTDPASHMYGDVHSFLLGGEHIADPGRTKRLDDYDMEETLMRMRGFIYREMRSSCGTAEEMVNMREKVHRAIGWIRKGFRKCERRWHHASPYRVCDLFRTLEYKFSEKAKYGEYGDRLIISVSPKNLTCDIKRIDREYDPDDY